MLILLQILNQILRPSENVPVSRVSFDLCLHFIYLLICLSPMTASATIFIQISPFDSCDIVIRLFS